MHAHGTSHHGTFDAGTAIPGGALFASAAKGGARYSSHGRAALATALDDGLMPDEVAQILAGRRITDAFPVWHGESPPAYAARAVAEMFVAYLR